MHAVIKIALLANWWLAGCQTRQAPELASPPELSQTRQTVTAAEGAMDLEAVAPLAWQIERERCPPLQNRPNGLPVLPQVELGFMAPIGSSAPIFHSKPAPYLYYGCPGE